MRLLVATALAAAATGAQEQSTAPLKLVHTITLPSYTGDFDHFAVDRRHARILLAAEDHATLEVFDLKTGKHLRTVKGFDAPHSIIFRPHAATFLITDSGPTMTKILDANTDEIVGKIPLVEGADSSGYDPVANIVYIDTGGKNANMKVGEIQAVNPDTGEKLGEVKFNDNHVEGMALEQNGDRLYVNLVQTNKLAVVNRKTMKTMTEWPVTPCQQNAMVILNEPQKQLYVVCRQPGMVVVMNSDTGSVVTTQTAPMRADQMLFDAKSHRLYVLGGEGYIGIYDTAGAGGLKMVAKFPSAPGAKTGILLPDMKKLIVAVSPGATGTLAKVLTYSIQ
jgi:DNA-binding beta-propeller fold protein YncE